MLPDPLPRVLLEVLPQRWDGILRVRGRKFARPLATLDPRRKQDLFHEKG